MTGVYSIIGFVAQLKAIEHDMNALGPAIVARACEMVCEEAKRVIGEGYPYWPALQPETLARKMMNPPAKWRLTWARQRLSHLNKFPELINQSRCG
jgi:hypothetical protein